MSAALRLGDRALLRICDPTIDESMTVRLAYERYRVPTFMRLEKRYAADCAAALARWEVFETRLGELAQRIRYPLRTQDVTSSHLQAFAQWLSDTTCLGPDRINNNVGEVLAILKLAADNGHEIRSLRYKRLPKVVGAKIFFDPTQIARLWLAAGETTWPPQECRKRGLGFGGTGMESSTWWRAVIILMRTYGMRVQDLVAYQGEKQPLTWRGITFDAQSPNPSAKGKEGCQWELGWLSYRAGKLKSRGGKQYYLPLTKHSRAAIDRLRTAAAARAAALGLDAIPQDWPILPCPRGRLTDHFRKLTTLANVMRDVELLSIEELGGQWLATTSVSSKKHPTEAEARDWSEKENYFVLEDFRKTAGTEYAVIDSALANRVCGWSEGHKVNTGQKHYILDEPILVRHLPTAPMPKCFDDWLSP